MSVIKLHINCFDNCRSTNTVLACAGMFAALWPGKVLCRLQLNQCVAMDKVVILDLISSNIDSESIVKR